MRIAFDLDDTLIPCGHRFATEPPTRRARWLGCEPLRKGTVELFRHLRARGWEVWVYTTSQRRPWSVRLQFWAYGLRLGGVVNQDRHVRCLRGRQPDHRDCSKYPPAFQVDLLVDDSEGTLLEGKRFRFRVLWVRPDDPGWAAAVRDEAERWRPAR